MIGVGLGVFCQWYMDASPSALGMEGVGGKAVSNSGKICGYDLGFSSRLARYPRASQFTSLCLFPVLKKMLWNLSTSPRYCEDIR